MENSWIRKSRKHGDYFNILAENAQSWDTTKSADPKISQQREKGGIYVLSEEDNISARVASLTRKVEAMELGKGEKTKEVESICGIYSSNQHATQDYPTISAFQEVLQEQSNAINNYELPFSNPNSNTYNSSWKDSPNFSWRNGPTANANNTP